MTNIFLCQTFLLYLHCNIKTNKMDRRTEHIKAVIAAFMIVIFAAIILAWPTQLLWNSCLVPAINGVNEIGFFQALGLNILAGIMIKSNTKSSNK